MQAIVKSGNADCQAAANATLTLRYAPSTCLTVRTIAGMSQIDIYVYVLLFHFWMDHISPAPQPGQPQAELSHAQSKLHGGRVWQSL